MNAAAPLYHTRQGRSPGTLHCDAGYDPHRRADPPTATSKVNFVLFPPVKGEITQKYNPKEKHFAVDVVVPRDTPVKATADGMVIFSEWTAATGYVIIIEHSNNLVSVYKHNASLTKQQGDLVTAGEVIASVGNTGELTTGPHLHFELWSEGYSIDPATIIDFKL